MAVRFFLQIHVDASASLRTASAINLVSVCCRGHTFENVEECEFREHASNTCICNRASFNR